MPTELNLELRQQVDATSPFWHRDEPTTSAFRVDPGYARLRAAFPQSWARLVESKLLLDCCAMLDCCAVVDSGMVDSGIGARGDGQDGVRQELARRIAGSLWTVAELERSSRPQLAGTVSASAELFAMYAATGEWKPAIVDAPADGQPWFYCGRLSTWSARTSRDPLSLLVVVPDERGQRVITETDARFDIVHAIAERTLDTPAGLVEKMPDMYLGDLLLAGGESARGHKNFAHFFPLEAPEGSVLDRDFTVVFGNVLKERVRRCSMPLLREALGGAELAQHTPEQLVDSLLVWFRGHDLGHFWRRTDRDSTRTRVREEELGPFLGMALEETYADCLGILTAAELADSSAFSQAFGAEHIRYLSRRNSDFADSVAATLELGWLAQRGFVLPASSEAWLTEAVPALTELVRTIHTVLWEDDRGSLDALFSAIAEGRRLADLMEDGLRDAPTDLSFIFA